jgi:type II secretory pathway pseudopilin PulG
MSIVSVTSFVPIGIIAAISIPNLLASRMAANEGSAIYSLRQISNAQSMYYQNFEKYGTLEELATQGLIDPRLGAGTKNGYNFILELTNNEVAGFAVVGVPITYRSTGKRSFYVDESFVIRVADNNGTPPSKLDLPLGESSDYTRRTPRLDDHPQTVY